MSEARRAECLQHIHLYRVVRGDDRCERGQEQPRQDQRPTNDHSWIPTGEVSDRACPIGALNVHRHRDRRAAHAVAFPYEIRGSSHAYSRSTSSVVIMKENADTSTTPWTTG